MTKLTTEAKELADLWFAGERQRARDAAAQLVNRYPDNLTYLERLAQFEWGLGNYEIALSWYDRLIRQQPNHAGAIIGRAAVLRCLGKLSEAREALHLAHKFGIRHPQLLAEWVAHGEMETLAAPDLEAVKHQLNDKLTIELGHDAARLLRMHGEIETAQTLLTRLRAAHKGNVMLALEQARNYRDAGQHDNAMGLFEELESSTTDNHALAQILFEKGHALRQCSDFDEARAANELALRFDPAYVMASKELASLDMEEGKFDEAARRLYDVLKTSPGFVEAWYVLTQNAILSRQIGPWFDAMNQIERLCIGKTTRHALWNRVNRAAGLYLANHLNETLKTLNDSRSILQREDEASRYYKVYWIYIRRLIQWRAENQDKFGVGTQHGLLHVVGESHALSANYALVDWHDGRKLRCVSHWVPGCKQWHLANEQANRYKSALACILAQIPPGSDLMLCIGEIDARPEEGIWKTALKTGESVEVLTQRTVEGYLKFIDKLVAAKAGINSITLQGVPAPGYPLEGRRDPGDKAGFLRMVHEFNQLLMAGAHARGWYFLDVYAATATVDGVGNERWHLDQTHLQPGFYGEAEKWLQIPTAR